MERLLVIKVKYGETLRRFTTYVSHTVHLMGPDAYVRKTSMDMDALKAKIVGLFNFDSGAELSITYIDEDDDVVTLVNDEDLADAIRQRINPLRLEVTLKNPKIGEPLRSPRVLRDPSTVISSGLEEALKSLPEPISIAISGLSHHLAAKATESSPVIREIVEQITKLSQNVRSNHVSSSQVRDASEAARVNPPVSVADPSNGADAVTSSQIKTASVSVPIDIIPPSQPVAPSGAGGKPILASATGSLMDLDLGLKSAPVAPPTSVFYPSDCAGLSENGRGRRDAPTMLNGTCPPGAVDPVPVYRSPFAGLNFETAEMQAPWPCTPGPPLLHNWDSASQCFHRGVICDGCGMHPIVGPRYKSKVKDDYDLCSGCFARMGNEADYTRLDRAVYRPPHTSREFYKHHPHFGGRHGWMPGPKHCKLKLDSRFIKDVTILDGTIVAPNTPFTKIWRMRNSGTLPWPSHSQLIWIGGDQMGNATSVDLEISQNGLPVDEELEIAVDFVSPSRPGRYTSNWRMLSPTGQKFGQRVWVLIQVDMIPLDGASHPQVSSSPLNLNVSPPQSTDYKQKGIELMDLDIPAPPVPKLLSEDHRDATSVSNISSPQAAPFIPHPTFSKAFAGNGGAAVEVPVGISAEEPIRFDGGLRNMEQTTMEAEETLLKELAEMGFKQINLNKEVLRRNEYDLQQSVDDLCGTSEWDTMLDELKEMGFCDVETNKKLLEKNGGSIKRVVLDLISGKKP